MLRQSNVYEGGIQNIAVVGQTEQSYTSVLKNCEVDQYELGVLVSHQLGAIFSELHGVDPRTRNFLCSTLTEMQHYEKLGDDIFADLFDNSLRIHFQDETELPTRVERICYWHILSAALDTNFTNSDIDPFTSISLATNSIKGIIPYLPQGDLVEGDPEKGIRQHAMSLLSEVYGCVISEPYKLSPLQKTLYLVMLASILATGVVPLFAKDHQDSDGPKVGKQGHKGGHPSDLLAAGGDSQNCEVSELEIITYTVAPGDTLYKIWSGLPQGVRLDWDSFQTAILGANPSITSSDKIIAGTDLNIPVCQSESDVPTPGSDLDSTSSETPSGDPDATFTDENVGGDVDSAPNPALVPSSGFLTDPYGSEGDFASLTREHNISLLLFELDKIGYGLDADDLHQLQLLLERDWHKKLDLQTGGESEYELAMVELLTASLEELAHTRGFGHLLVSPELIDATLEQSLFLPWWAPKEVSRYKLYMRLRLAALSAQGLSPATFVPDGSQFSALDIAATEVATLAEDSQERLFGLLTKLRLGVGGLGAAATLTISGLLYKTIKQMRARRRDTE